ncbi:MAG: PSD1 and planctomycete cytochrome C domain-containing protein [Planctomycetota bacterium]
MLTSPLRLAAIICFVATFPTPAQSAEPTEGEKLFALRVQPILREKCFGCHSDEADELEGGFDISSRAKMLAGGDGFGDTVVFPGDHELSALMPMISREDVGYEMPPKEADGLTQEEVWAIRDWINDGAPWPSEERVAEIYALYAKGVLVKTSGGQSDQWTNRKYEPENLWAFQPVLREFSRDLDLAKRNPIDIFIEARLESEGIQPAATADRVSLIRRATFDLTGLPPTPSEVKAFVDDVRPDQEAFAALVDRLLESPHYGEHWARHWLDVVRYADSSGFANDWERPNAWRYRDYVIRAFNTDKPFDLFTLEQLAGDEIQRWVNEKGVSLDDVREVHRLIDEVDPDELVIAAGFLRMGPWEHTGMSVAKVTRQQFLDDITDSVGQVFLAQPLQCCRCHDHKFDPIPTRDYYSIQSVFATTQFAERKTQWLSDENREGMKEDERQHQMRVQANEAMMRDLAKVQREFEAKWFADRNLPYKTKAEAKKAGVDPEQLPHKSLKSAADFGRERIGRKWRTRFRWELDRYQPYAFSVYTGKTPAARSQQSRFVMPTNPMAKGNLEKTVILPGGDPFAKGDPVKPGVLSAVPGGLEFELPESPHGRRLALAKWIVDPNNSLTSRVIANRIWTYHFGRGIAGTPNNFGATGKKPTHPELLDWLAGEMVRNDWSIKNLHRRIMNSDAYQRSTRHQDVKQLDQLDPKRESYAVFLPRRLEAEEIRDSMLFVTDEWNPAVGGIPVRPDMNLEAALQPRMIMGTFAPSYVPSPRPEDRNRRTIYAHRIRGHRLPFMETFNQPGSETSCELRDQSNITPQVFAMLNGEEANDRALALAHRVIQETQTSDRRLDRKQVVRRLFELVYSRLPTERESQLTLDHWQTMAERQAEIHPQKRVWPTEVIREAVDENTGEPFQFTEQLFVYKEYVPDLQPDQVDAVTRGLADICLALLNSNEFIYVY